MGREGEWVEKGVKDRQRDRNRDRRRERKRERERTPGRLGIAINQGLSGIRLPADPTTRLLKVSQGLNINLSQYLRHPI